ncbi:hypothetical protein RRG08_017979 [Elysia crispata]|uniref:Uncharacterized protein n=1 Tax=Elysia crispata TaxID=231223 RepID=A0AAE0ZD63_9GAST|nr:hypothetical protein RRG08_017979 [Elysia crispata]
MIDNNNNNNNYWKSDSGVSSYPDDLLKRYKTDKGQRSCATACSTTEFIHIPQVPEVFLQDFSSVIRLKRVRGHALLPVASL